MFFVGIPIPQSFNFKKKQQKQTDRKWKKTKKTNKMGYS